MSDQITVHCEGCDATYTREPRGRGRRGSMAPDWSGCGRSRKHPGRIAEWCPRCVDSVRLRWTNPTAREVKTIAESPGGDPQP